MDHLIWLKSLNEQKRCNTSTLQTDMTQHRFKMGMCRILVHMTIATFFMNGAFSIDPYDKCPQPIVQNTAVPWITKLQPDQRDLLLHSMSVGHLPNCSFVKSPKLKVSVLHFCWVLQRKGMEFYLKHNNTLLLPSIECIVMCHTFT